MTGAGGERGRGAFPASSFPWAVGTAIVCLLLAIATPVTKADWLAPGLPGEHRRVVAVDVETGAELWFAPARTGDVVVYEYIHSADKTPVESRLRVADGEAGFVLEQERYLWYGAGLEFRADYGVVLEDGWVVVYTERPVSRLPLRVAGTVEQRIIVGDCFAVLGELAPFGRRIMLEVRP